MAGNIQADNSGNVYVEFDYNNIIVVDPNKTIDNFGKVQERLIDHENLVMYANLEADVLPRTKLAVGTSPGSGIQTISVAKMNFLKPTKDNYLSTGYYDELTGYNSRSGKGQNQTAEIYNTTGNNRGYKRTVVNEGEILDNGLLGITSINVTTNSSFVPGVTIELEDVQGKALFELGDKSPYSAFFNLPYPQFYLTLKGYFGQAIRYQLNLEKFNARFNSFSGNYQVTLQFRGYKFNILNEIAMGHLLATPHMYSKTFTTSTPEASNSTNNVVNTVTSEKGYQKIKEVYSEYKSKGLIPQNLPELTLVQLMNKLENFENFIINSYPKANLEPLTNIRTYKNTLKQYYERIRGDRNSWFTKCMDPKPLILKNELKVYFFKKEFSPQNIEDAKTDLKKDIDEFNTVLAENNTLGKSGSTPIVNTIKYDIIKYGSITTNDVNWKKTSEFQTGSGNDDIVQSIINTYSYLFFPKKEDTVNSTTQETTSDITYPDFFVFQSKGRFDDEIISMEAQANKKLSDYETAITADLAKRLEDSAVGIGFKPNVRNIVGVIMASAEAFIRLLDDVHTAAWNVKYDEVRKKAILDNETSASGTDTVGYVNQVESQFAKTPVYPWPQFFVETPEDKKGRFQLKYIADPSIVDATQGYLFEKWPEVEFVEEYMKGITKKFDVPYTPDVLENQRDTNQMIINAIEYPETNISYLNKEEVKFFYEIWERQFLTANYSGLIRDVENINELVRLIVETETENIKNSLGLSSPFLTFKLKNFKLNQQTYYDFLKNISNGGTGRSWQDFTRDFFVTRYIRSMTENPFSILSINDLGKLPQLSPKEVALQLLTNSSKNQPLIVDTLPFRDANWVSNNMDGSSKSQGNQVYNTNKTYKVFEPRNILANFTDVYNFTECRPVTNFAYLTPKSNPTPTIETFSNFYLSRSNNSEELIVTEGYITQFTPINNSTAAFGIPGFANSLLDSEKTTSMLNTPYFVNSILNGVFLQRSNNPYPYIQAAYLFINSLPLITLRERYKKTENSVVSELDYMSAVFKKYAALHKVPYAWILKFGSIWHRYKKFKENDVDIIETAWNDFDYITNYSPIQKSAEQTYSFKYGLNNVNITLQTIGADSANMNVGFYPKVITDFNYFYNGFDYYQNFTNEEIQNSVNNGLKIYNYGSSNIQGVNQNGLNLNETTWSVLLPEFSLAQPDVTCTPPNNTKGDVYYIVPSFGSTVNQSYYECVGDKNTTKTALVPLTSNQSLFNGSVRMLWAASNYGYFDNSQVRKPPIDCYINKINPQAKQAPFKLLIDDSYSKIEEIFSVFDKTILDKFEQEFLNFAKPKTDIPVLVDIVTFDETTYDNTAQFRNFQNLFTNLMSVPPQTGNSEDEYFNNVIGNQLSNFSVGIKSFLEFDVILRMGNPSFYKRRIFSSYLSYQSIPEVVSPISFKPYVAGSLPSSGGTTTIVESILSNQDAWRALETEVGFSTISGANYSNSGSTITDFFIDNNIEFIRQNIVLLAPIIKMYATEKLQNPKITVSEFKTMLNDYLSANTGLQDIILNDIMTRLNRDLPDQQQLPERNIQSAIDGQQSKVENYEVFKALNDKWISGADFREKTLFEDMLFLDRASRNIGDIILLDIFDLKNMFSEKSLNNAMSVFTFIGGILIKNNFTVMNLPAYVNFYNVQSADGTTIPKTEGSLDFANSMWGTFMNVDYRQSSAKMVCFFVGKPSEHLDLPKSDFRFRDDGFDMRRASESPLIENQEGKKDWALSNKCVGFNVDIGTRNQNVFYSFSVDQNAGNATSESINTQLYMIDQASGRNSATQNVSLYNFYKLRSYQATVTSLGNALIQPTMYFNLRHVPMFNGPYMITQVEHSIQPGNFQTQFTGVRQGIYDLPAIDNFLQQVNKNLLTKLQQLVKVKQDKPATPSSGKTETQKSNDVIQDAEGTKAPQNSCVSKLNQYYSDQKYDRSYLSKEALQTNMTPKEFANILNSKFPNNPGLRVIIYSICYIRTFAGSSFNGFDYNYATISLSERIIPEEGYLRTYSCINLKPNTPEPIANFENLDKFTTFMASKITPNVDRVVNGIGILEYYVCNWQTNENITKEYFEKNINQYKPVETKIYQAVKSAIQAGVITEQEQKQLELGLNISQSTERTPGTTPTPAPETPYCPPAEILSFAPTQGVTGTIVQVNGKNLLTTNRIVVNGEDVNMKFTQIFNNETLRFSVPVKVSVTPTTGKIQIFTEYNDVTSINDFTHL
jgi:hypothetical protein